MSSAAAPEATDRLGRAHALELCRDRQPGAQKRAYATVAVASLILMAGTNLPSPLYPLYRQTFELSALTITLIFALYSFTLIPALLLFGPLGDAIGRRRVLIIALALAGLGVAILAAAQGLPWLLAGRAVQGVAVGAASGNVAAALVELHPRSDPRRAGLHATTAIMGGGALGPLSAGLVAQYLPSPRVLVYLVELALLLAALALVARVQETPPRRRKLELHRPGVPPAIRGAFASAALTAALAWAMGGLFLGLVPSYVAALLDTRNLAVGGSVVALMLLSAGATQIAARDQPSRRLEPGGLATLVLGLAIVVLAYPAGSSLLLFAGALICGAGLGGAFLGAISSINEIAPPAQRGNVSSLFFVLVYLATGLPVIAAGVAATQIGLYPAVRDFAVVVGVLALANLAWIALRHRRSPTPAGAPAKI